MAWGTPTSIGTAANPANANSLSITVPAGGVPAGALIVVCEAHGGTADVSTGVSDSAGNSYSEAGYEPGSSGIELVVWYAYNVSALAPGDTITMSFSVNSRYALSALYATGEETGADPRDATAQAAASSRSSTPSATLAAAPAVANSLVVAALAWNSTTGFTQAAGWSAPPDLIATSSSTATVAGGSEVTSTADTYAPTLGAVAQWALLLVVFKPASGSTVTLVASGASLAAGKGGGHFAAALAATGAGRGGGRADAGFTAVLAAIGAARARGGVALSGAAALLGSGIARGVGRGAINFGTIALVAAGAALGMARAAVGYLALLSGSGGSEAAGRAGGTAAASLAAAGSARGAGKAAGRFAAALGAKGAARAAGAAALSTGAGIAVAARGFALAFGRAAMRLFRPAPSAPPPESISAPSVENESLTAAGGQGDSLG
jgi:hypothetical protein